MWLAVEPDVQLLQMDPWQAAWGCVCAVLRAAHISSWVKAVGMTPACQWHLIIAHNHCALRLTANVYPRPPWHTFPTCRPTELSHALALAHTLYTSMCTPVVVPALTGLTTQIKCNGYNIKDQRVKSIGLLSEPIDMPKVRTTAQQMPCMPGCWVLFFACTVSIIICH